MILKGSQRAGGRDLATHLSNEYDNERIEIAAVRGTVADDLHSAFAEFEAVAAGTRCAKPLYSLSVNPASPLSREQYMAALDHIEDRLGLTGQPRAVVFHVKNGREHCHVVWSRIDTRTMRAVHISHDHMKLRTCARELAQAYGLTLPHGLAEDRGDARFEKVRDLTHAEKAMAEASGLSPEKRRAEITALYRASDSAESFRAGLDRAGYILAQGEKRSYVVVDNGGHVHALARQIEGVRTRALKERLAALPAETLPSVEQAKEQQGAHQQAQDERLREVARVRGAKSAADLATKQKTRRGKLDLKRQQLEVVHRHERLSLRAAQKSEDGHLFNIVAARFFALFDRVPGLRSVIAPLRRNPAINAAERHQIELEALKRRHGRERAGLDGRAVALESIDTRERRSLIRDLIRETRVTDRLHQAQGDQRRRELSENAAQVTRPAAAREETREEQRARIREQLETLKSGNQSQQRMRRPGHSRD